MKTYGDLRRALLEAFKTDDRFEFGSWSDEHQRTWNEINAEEFSRGYTPYVYEREDSPALCDLPLLTEDEFEKKLSFFLSRLGYEPGIPVLPEQETGTQEPEKDAQIEENEVKLSEMLSYFPDR